MTRNARRNFPVGVTEELGNYVYLYYDPRDAKRLPFYIGRGVNNRVFSHLFEAESTASSSGKLERIREIWDSGEDVGIVIQRHGLEEEAAKAVEATLIEMFPCAENLVEGSGTQSVGARLLEDLISEKAREEASIDFPAVLINIRTEWAYIKPRALAEVDQDRLCWSTRTAWRGSITAAAVSAISAVKHRGGPREPKEAP